MGIPLYFRYLINNYDNILNSNVDIKNIDNLYLDLNCAIHYCCRQILKDVDYDPKMNNKIEDKMINNIINYIELLVDYSKPQKLLYITIDGVAPKAKMVQQRMRRFKKFYEKEELNKIRCKLNLEIDEKKEWDTNSITPGTVFMSKLAVALKQKLCKSERLSKINLIISDSNIAGEGEHKILKYLKENKELKDEINAIYGLDADLIMLSLILQYDNMLLLRETVEFDNTIHKDGYKFLYLNINRLEENLILELQNKIDVKFLTNNEKNNILNDYIFLSFILGNDFICHSPIVSIKNKGIDLIMNLYSRYYNELKTNLVNKEKKKIKNDFLKYILRDLSLMEDTILVDFNNKRKKKKKPNKIYDTEFDREKDLLNLYPQLNRDLEKEINQGSFEWRERYYNLLFNTDNQYEIDKICHNYIEGLFWNFHYYFYECISWDWCYSYNNPPSFLDIYNYYNNYISDINLIKINKSKPVKPFQQLLMVLPKESKNLLPIKYQKLMTNYESDIIEYYPEKYKLNTINKYYLWECQPKLPYIITENIINTTKNINLSENEKNRNKINKIYIRKI